MTNDPLFPAFMFLALVIVLGLAETWAHRGFQSFLKTGSGIVCALLILYGLGWLLITEVVR